MLRCCSGRWVRLCYGVEFAKQHIVRSSLLVHCHVRPYSTLSVPRLILANFMEPGRRNILRGVLRCASERVHHPPAAPRGGLPVTRVSKRAIGNERKEGGEEGGRLPISDRASALPCCRCGNCSHTCVHILLARAKREDRRSR